MSNPLVTKYGDARLPRYTSYPTAPKFSNEIGASTYASWLSECKTGATSLYLHIPFCRSMCWYCGCHTTITERDQPIMDYLNVLRREIEIVSDTAPAVLDVKEIHFGGGTPTIITPDEFRSLIELLTERFNVRGSANVSVEIDPRTLTAEMAAALGSSKATRASLGVQSFDPKVQKAINRIQSAETTASAVTNLRSSGIDSINFDLIYGLPHQTVSSCVETVETALQMKPDRFSVFGYAHIPSFKKHQRLIDEDALAGAEGRNEQSEAIAAALIENGYVRIGLDHFALPEDDLALAARDGTLHRNFQGYTTDDCGTLIGLGASSIGRFQDGYVQNEVAPGSYARQISSGSLATVRGYSLTKEDRLRARIIERVMCDFSVDLRGICGEHGVDFEDIVKANSTLHELVSDGVVRLVDGVLTVADDNRFLVRAVASAFDSHLADIGRTFSKAA